MNQSRLMSVKDVQAEYRQSHVGVYRRINAGDFEAVKIGRGTFIIRDSVEKYLASLPRMGQQAA